MFFIDQLAKMPAGTPPAVQKSTRRLMKLAVWFGGLGLVLPFVLPESAVLSNSALFQFLERLVPSATKAASVAQYPNVVRVYFSLMLTLAPVLALYFLIWHEPWRTRMLPMEKFGSLRKVACLGACILMVGILLCLGLLIYFLPGTVSSDSRGSRGQLIFSLIVMTKPGLAIFGGFISVCALFIWQVSFQALGLTLLLPFLPKSRSNTR
jgi:hypothetical protein